MPDESMYLDSDTSLEGGSLLLDGQTKRVFEFCLVDHRVPVVVYQEPTNGQCLLMYFEGYLKLLLMAYLRLIHANWGSLAYDRQ